MESIILSHPVFAIIVVAIIVIVGRYLFTSKDAGNNMEKQYKDGITQLEKQLTASLHQIELSFTQQFGSMGEKIRQVQNETMRDVEEKYFTKEMANKHDFRISKVEETVAQILPRMEKIDLIYDIVTNKDK